LVLACGNTAAAPDQEVAECAADGGDPAASEYVLPYPMGRTYTLIQGNCPSDPSWGHYGWYAYDFDLSTGDTVIASRAGQVRFVREDQPDIGGRCGVNGENLVVVEHSDGTVMFYAHLTTDGALVEAGQQVGQGQPIGLSGNSGCSSGPHLHVGLYRSSACYERQDSRPFNYLNAAGPLDENRHLVQGQSYTAGSP
jgi:murein DD-endopeptidase MepM/ murein hydrolase activator NlpD